MGKKDEFKPDYTQRHILYRLQVSPQQRKEILKWFLYAVACVGLLVLQDVIFSRMRLWGGTTDLLPCALLMICVLQGAEKGGIFTLVASVLYYFSGSAPGVYVILLIPLLGTVVSAFRQGYLRKGFSATMLCVGAAAVVYQLGVYLMGLLLGQTILSRVFVFVVTGGISAATLPLLYPLLQAIGKIGGEAWRE